MKKLFIIGIIYALFLSGLAVIPVSTMKSIGYEAYRDFNRYEMVWETRNWNEIAGRHFIVKYDTADSKMA